MLIRINNDINVLIINSSHNKNVNDQIHIGGSNYYKITTFVQAHVYVTDVPQFEGIIYTDLSLA